MATSVRLLGKLFQVQSHSVPFCSLWKNVNREAFAERPHQAAVDDIGTKVKIENASILVPRSINSNIESS